VKNKFELNEQFARKLDSIDPLASFRERFYIPENTIYLDGNSLGLMPKDSEKSVQRVMDEWKRLGINGWTLAKPPWFYMCENLGAKAARLVGAKSEEVVCTGTTTVNLHALVSTFYDPVRGRTKILADELNFPTDIYALKGQIKLKGLNEKENLVLVPSQDGRILQNDKIIQLMTGDVGLILLSSVLYRSGQLLDIPLLTKEAHDRGIPIGFDCSHSVGAIPHKFSDWEVDFAFWCSYKYMNCGPGAPAFLYINHKHFDREPLLAGWFGYIKEKQFDMILDFNHSKNAGGWQISTPTILGVAAVEGSLNILLEAGIEKIRGKSLKMTDYLMCLIDHYLPKGRYNITIGTPRESQNRSGHVALEGGDELWQVYQAAKERGIIPDFRSPNIIRIAPVALYNTYYEIWQTVQCIKEIIDSKEYEVYPMKRTVIT
jgi:kynureninase